MRDVVEEDAEKLQERLGRDRFTISRHLGSGGMGSVYLAHDRATKTDVALKTLLISNPASILALKREFRFLADVSHPNLVALYELICVNDL